MPSTLTPPCTPPATQTAASLPAPAAGQGVGTQRNRAAWLSIADFLARQNLRMVLAARAAQRAEGAPLAGEASAPCAAASALPVGNHGENQDLTVPQVQHGEALR